MPRLFTALEVSADAALSLSMLRGGIAGARWIDPENYHLTLRFIGDVDGIVAREIAADLDGVRRAPFTVAIEGVDTFGGRKPRAVVAKVVGSAPLLELQAELERVMQRAGLPPETRKYTPHVTLARLRGSTSRDVADYLAMHGLFRTGPFRAERFVLYSSRASTGGGPYVVEQSYPLGAI